MPTVDDRSFADKLGELLADLDSTELRLAELESAAEDVLDECEGDDDDAELVGSEAFDISGRIAALRSRIAMLDGRKGCGTEAVRALLAACRLLTGHTVREDAVLDACRAVEAQLAGGGH